MKVDQEAKFKVEKGRTYLVIDHPFFGSIMLRQRLTESRRHKTVATNYKHIFYNPDFIKRIGMRQIQAELVHEGMHNAFAHNVRRGNRDPRLWNIACDYAINLIIVDAGFQIDETWLVDEKYRGMNAEQIYDLLQQEDQQGGGSGDGGSDDQDGHSHGGHGEPCGHLEDMPGEGGGEATEGEKNQTIRQAAVMLAQAAMVAEKHGDLPASLKMLIDDFVNPKVAWENHLRRFVSQCARNDYSWMRPNRNMLYHGFYTPGLFTQEIDTAVVGIDSSGSCIHALPQFQAELAAILSGLTIRRLIVLVCDAGVHQMFELDKSDLPLKLKLQGGGGTSFKPVFEWIEKEGIQPSFLVYLTDMYGSFPNEPPPYPVLWASVGGEDAPFGEVVKVVTK